MEKLAFAFGNAFKRVSLESPWVIGTFCLSASGFFKNVGF